MTTFSRWLTAAAVLALLSLAAGLFAPLVYAQSGTVVFQNSFANTSDLQSNWCWTSAVAAGPYCSTGADFTQTNCPSGIGFTNTTCAVVTVPQGSGSGQEGGFILTSCFVNAGCGSPSDPSYNNGFDLESLSSWYAYVEWDTTAGPSTWQSNGQSNENFKLIYNKNAAGGPVGVCYYDGFVPSSGTNTSLRVICDQDDQQGTQTTVNLTPNRMHYLEESYSSGGSYCIRFDGTALGCYPVGQNLGSQVMTYLQPGIYLNGEASAAFQIYLSNFKICTGGWCSAASSTPNPVFTPPSLTFGSVRVGTASAMQTTTLNNSGGAALTWTSGPAISSGNFTQTGTTCGLSLAASASCSVTAECTPTATGALAGNITFSGANYGSGTLQVPLSCTGSSTGSSPPALGVHVIAELGGGNAVPTQRE